mgnify:CR=1 FL=1
MDNIKEALNYIDIPVGGSRPPLYYNSTDNDLTFIKELLEQQNIFSK